MKFSADDFQHLYAEMPDEELRSLVREELSDVARPCYDAELARRGLAATKPRPTIPRAVIAEEPARAVPQLLEVSEEAVEGEEEEDLVAAAVFAARSEAKAAKARLQSAAIPAFLEDDTAAGGGFRLLVAASYVEQVREALGDAQ
jgi:hypothetical protein